MTTRVVLLEEGTAEMKGLLGSKGAALAELCQAGWPVPAGFTITTEYSHEFLSCSETTNAEGSEDLAKAVRQLEQHTGTAFGDPEAPLLLAVQSSDVLPRNANSLVLLSVGLNDITVEGFARRINNRPYALNCYRCCCRIMVGWFMASRLRFSMNDWAILRVWMKRDWSTL